MSSSTYLERKNKISKEIADLEKKRADFSKQIADKNTRIVSIQKSLKSTSASSVKSKLGQIDSLNEEIARLQVKVADIEKKIAQKRVDETKVFQQYQTELDRENKKKQQEQKKLTDSYQKRINELTGALNRSVRTQMRPVTTLYSQIQEDPTIYDVFISHAHEDKEGFATPFVDELKKRGVKVWYDNDEIKWGDSLRAKIDSGLNHSRFGIVVISRSFISKGWTNHELDGLFNLEMTHGKTILPIWHDITKTEVQNFSPSLAGKKAMSTAVMTPAEIADELVKLLNK